MRARAGCLWLSIACSGPPPIATLTHRQGHVERDVSAAPESWQAANVGANFLLGDGVRTLSDASASLLLDDATRLELGAATTVRFSPTRPAAPGHAFDVQTGAARVQAGEQAVSIQTRVGLARLERGSSVLLSPAASGLRFEVRVGRAAFGVSDALEAGERVTVDHSGAVSSVDGPSARDALARANLVLADPSGAITATVRGSGASLRTGEGWARLAEGPARLASGAQLETGAQTSIEIARGGQHAVLGEHGRYVLGDGAVLVNVQGGSVLVGGPEALRVEVPGGVILVPAAGQALLQVSARGTQVASRALDAVVETGERLERVGVGHSAWLARDGRLRHEPETSSGEPDPGEAVDVADLVLPGGTSAVVHDPAPPSAVRFEPAEPCAGQASVRLVSAGGSVRRAAGSGSVALSVPAGHHRYELRCGTERALGGSVSVLHDAATRSIASKPPRTALVADGRKYTVLYQNRLPAIELSWPSAPAASDLRLIHRHAGAQRSLALREARRELESGELKEGEHTFYFEGGGSVSRQTSVAIVFDNAAPRASLLLPPVLEQRPGEPVVVSGTALPGSEVWVEGERVPADARGRFSVSSRLPLDRRALTIRLVQPGRGTHYYLRRGRPP